MICRLDAVTRCDRLGEPSGDAVAICVRFGALTSIGGANKLEVAICGFKSADGSGGGMAPESVRGLDNHRQAKAGVFARGGLLRLADGPLRPDNERCARAA